MSDAVTSYLVDTIQIFMSSDVPSVQCNENFYINNEEYCSDKPNELSKHSEATRRINMELTQEQAEEIFKRPLLVSLERDQMLTNACKLRNEINRNIRESTATISSTGISNNKVSSASSEMQKKVISVPYQVNNEEKEEEEKKLLTSSNAENYKSRANCIDNDESKNRWKLFVANQATCASPSTLCTESLSSSCTSLPCPHEAVPVPIPSSHSPERKTTLSHKCITLTQEEQEEEYYEEEQQHENCHDRNNMLTLTPMESNATPTSQRYNDGSYLTTKNIINMITPTTITTNVNEKQSIYNINVDSIRDKWRKLALERHLRESSHVHYEQEQ